MGHAHQPSTSAALRFEHALDLLVAGRRAPRRAPRAVWTTCAGSFSRPRTGCGARYGASVSTSRRSCGHARRRLAQVTGRRVGEVAGERDPVAALDALVEPVGHREAVHDHAQAAAALVEHVERVLGRVARVDHERLAGLARQLDLRVEGARSGPPRGP